MEWKRGGGKRNAKKKKENVPPPTFFLGLASPALVHRKSDHILRKNQKGLLQKALFAASSRRKK